MNKNISFSSVVSTVIAVIAVVSIASAWTEPAQNPPQGNVPAPLNVSNAGQLKEGGLIINTGGAATGLIVDKGNVGIGTQTPAQKLDINGVVKMLGFSMSTSAGAGKVLTSDASGNGTWQDTAGGGGGGTAIIATYTEGPYGCDNGNGPSGTVIAYCPSGWKAIGGGGECGHCSSAVYGQMEKTIPYGENGWQIACDENGNATWDGGKAYVRCIKF